MTTDSNREAFERWAEDNHLSVVRCSPTGHYSSEVTAWCWMAVQAATAHNKEKLREVRDIVAAHYVGTSPDRPDIVDAARRSQSVAVPADKWLRLHACIPTLNEMIGDF